MSADTPHWTPVESWKSEQPYRCGTCGETLAGRELGWMPNMCDRDGCPGATDRGDLVVVVPASALDDLRTENESLQAQLRGGKAAFKELAYTAEALRGDRVRALESDRHRIRADDLEAERDAAVRERDHYREALERADWLITCLRSVTRRVPVRNLDEAEEGWRIARAALAVPAPPTKEENDA